MKSKTSFFNKGIILNDFKRFLWIGVVYFLGLFFAGPLKILMNYNSENLQRYTHNYSDYTYEGNPIRNIFYFNYNEILGILILIVPVLAAVFLFMYIHNKKSADMIHSLPIKREKMYNSHIVAGLVILIIPIIINGAISVILNTAMHLEKYCSVKDIINCMTMSIIISIVLFSASVFVAMNTGNSIAQGILTYIVLLLPFGIIGLLTGNLNRFIYGFSSRMYFSEEMEFLSPITRLFSSPKMPMTLKEVGIYVLICILFCLLGRVLYKIRNIEAASNIIAFSKLNPIFKYGVTFCSMLVGGLYFGSFENSIINWIIFGYVSSSLIGYFLAQMAIKKSLYVFKDIKGYYIYIIVIVLLGVGIKSDMFGYEKYTPQLSDIKSVYYNYYYNNEEYKHKKDTYFEKENIKNIVDLHNQIIIEKKENENYKKNNEVVVFVYELKSGKKISREYLIPSGKYHKYLKSIYEAIEYKKSHYKIFKLNYSNIEMFQIVQHGNYNRDSSLIITNPSEIKEAIDAIKDDLINKTYEQELYDRGPASSIEITLKNKNKEQDDFHEYIGEFDKNSKKLEEWLTTKGYIKNVKITKEDIKYILIEKITNRYVDSIKENKGEKRLEIKDKSQMEFLLNNYKRNREENSEYIVEFHLNNGRIFNGTLDNNDIPDFVSNYFNK